MRWRRPPNRLMSITSPIACMTLPAARNKSRFEEGVREEMKHGGDDRELGDGCRRRSREP